MRRILPLIILVAGFTAQAAAVERVRLNGDTVFYVRPDGNDNNSGLTDTKEGAWADPQFAIDHITDNFDFANSGAKIKMTAGEWTPLVCNGPHVGRGSLTLEGAGDGTIIGIPGRTALTIFNGCAMIVAHLSFAAGSLNGLAVMDEARASFGYVRWEQAKSAQIYVSREAIVEQFGPDIIAGSAAYHATASHHGIFRNVGWPTKFVADAAFTVYAYASSHGDITYTYNDLTSKPLISTNGFEVTGRRCLADLNGIVQAAALGPDFFPGTVDCFATSGGQILQ
jgi:hypothetical protein